MSDARKHQTIAVYDAQAAQFSEKFKNLLELHRRYEFQRFIELLPGKRILDAGCGGGDHALFFQEQGLSVKAIDLSVGMVRIAQDKGVDAQVMDLERMAFDELFDGIWCVTSLLHIPKERCPAVAKRMHDLLVPDGILYVCVKKGDGERVEQDGRFFAYWRMDELKELFGDFACVEEREVQLGSKVFLQAFFRKE